MIEIEIPGHRTIQAEYLVLDFNGTLALDGHLIDGVADQLLQLSADLEVLVLTADTFGTVRKELKDLPVIVKVLDPADQDRQKAEVVNQLGADRVIAVGNGRNDLLMLQESALGIGVILAEGAYVQIMNAIQVICTSITDALDLLLKPKRLAATLRN
ncbi:MAG TPA: ATPase P [Bacteroides sp.]|nr:ATPase P [Bacteroides sp.]